MNYSKFVPAVVLALSLANGLAHAETQPTGNLFQMSEVSAAGSIVAAKETDSKCGAGACGSAKLSEKKVAESKCASKKAADSKCAAKKSADSKCAAQKSADSKCASKKAADSKCAAKKSADSKCAAAKCASKKN